MAFEAGQSIVVREMLDGRPWAARPMVVARDDRDLTALYLPTGARWRCPVPASARLRVPPAEWRLEDRRWRAPGALQLVLPGAAHAWVAVWREASDGLRHWYVNFQRPLRRTPDGFDTLDLLLDLIVAPDLASFRWKDEAEYHDAVRTGAVSDDDAALVENEVDRVLASIEARSLPFDAAWASWRPPAASQAGAVAWRSG